MRFSTASVALLAGLVAAVPQVQPISQISDGQIQAPPATSKPVAATSAVPSSAPAVVSTPAYSAPAVVTSPVYSTPAVVLPTSVVVPANSTYQASSAPASAPASSKPAASQSAPGSSSKTSAGIPQQTNAAAENALSFGGLVFALAAAVFA